MVNEALPYVIYEKDTMVQRSCMAIGPLSNPEICTTCTTPNSEICTNTLFLSQNIGGATTLFLSQNLGRH